MVWRQIGIYAEMIRLSHTVFALPFALIAAALASHREGGWRILDLVGVLACMFFARSAAMGFNRWTDRALDAANPRTASRALPAGLLTPTAVLLFVVMCSLLFVASTSLFVLSSQNYWPLAVSVPVLAVLLGYSYAKRFTALAHLWLGLALGLSPLAAWLAIRGTVEWEPVLLGLAVLTWVAGFDILYACQDVEVDRQLGLQSIPARLGVPGAMGVARLLHLGTVVLLAAFGAMTAECGLGFWIAYGLIAGLLVVEHAVLAGARLERINLAFFYINAVIGGLLLTAIAFDLYLGGVE